MNTLGSIRWTLSATVFKRALVILLFLYIARVIDSEALGLFGTYTRFITLLTTFAVFSMDALYIVEKDSERMFPLFVSLPLLLGLIATIALPFTSGLIAALYETPELKRIVLYTFPILLVYVLRQVLKVSLKKEFRFKETSLFETVNVLAYSVAAIVFLFFWRSLWVVLIAFFCGDIIEMLLVLFSRKSRFPSRVLDSLFQVPVREKVAQLKANKGFLLTTTAMHLMGAFVGAGPIFLLGIAFPERGIEYTGLYFLAWNVVSLPVTLLTDSALQVFFPSFARMRPDEIQGKIQRFLYFTISTLWALLMFYIILASKLIPLFLGGEWLKTTVIMVIMGLSALSTLIMNPLSSIPIVFRKPHIEFIWRVASLVSTSAGLFIGAQFGFYHAILGFVVAKFLTHVVFLGIVFNMVRFDYISFWKRSGMILVCVALLAAALLISLRLGTLAGLLVATLSVVLYFGIVLKLSKGEILGEIKLLIKRKDAAS